MTSDSQPAARSALITGGSRGVGACLAALLAADGVDVTLTFRRSQEAADDVVAGIRAAGGSARAVRLELESAADIEALFAEGATFDCLVANAAASAFKPIERLSTSNLERSWETNVRSFVLLAQHAVSRMPRGGRVVAVTSYGASRAFPAYGAIGADKAALESWVRHMAAEFGERGITVNAVNGGLFDTDSFRHYYADDSLPDPETMAARVPLGRIGTPDDLAHAVRFLLSPEAGYITGQTLVVDGGLTIVAPPYWSEVRAAQRGRPDNVGQQTESSNTQRRGNDDR
ncbi:SDR family oxidoreductase [Planctomonas sp. JC2975]|uniref:SDR family oxidoreductase n=1 Tax=Planctomonas sp. JC2975 TaxID=2729626 RepID=UPI001F101D43|nr:SDR family oxidoreductase [Planctomonas sp. JC2975]